MWSYEIRIKLLYEKKTFINDFIAIVNLFCFIINCVFTEKRTYVNRGCDLEISFLLTVLLSVPFNKLPCI